MRAGARDGVRPRSPVAGVVLAAGEGSRFDAGSRADQGVKLLLPWEDGTVVGSAVGAALEAGLDPVVVVVGHRASEVRRALAGRPVRVIENPDWSRGQASSLHRGIADVRRRSDAAGAAVLLGDEPGVSPASIRAVVDAWRASEAPVARAAYEDRPGHPVVFDRSVFGELERLEGDRGARAWIASAGVGTVVVRVPGTAPADVDTPEAYRAALPDPASGGRGGSSPRSEA